MQPFQSIDIGSGRGYLVAEALAGSRLGGWLSRLPPKTVSRSLAKWQAGDDEALRAGMPVAYDEFRRLTRHYLRNERPDHTLQSAALVHESQATDP